MRTSSKPKKKPQNLAPPALMVRAAQNTPLDKKSYFPLQKNLWNQYSVGIRWPAHSSMLPPAPMRRPFNAKPGNST
jgi:hypothetical protein